MNICNPLKLPLAICVTRSDPLGKGAKMTLLSEANVVLVQLSRNLAPLPRELGVLFVAD